jgi:glycosyltransferase involved in cell wall biosynthesis
MNHLGSRAYDVVIAMFDLRWPIGLLPALSSRSYRYILWGHRASGRRWANHVRTLLMRRADGHILYGSEDVEKMVSSGIPRKSIYVAHNTIHVPNHCDCSGTAKRSFLFVGRAQTRKRVDLLVEAFAEIAGAVPEDFVVEIVGSGEENERIRRLVADRCLGGRVIFHGETNDPDVLRECYSRALAYVSPGDVGLGVLHSFAYGVPVVTKAWANHGPEAANLRHAENCLLFDKSTDLAACLIQLINDRVFAARLGANAYQLYSEERSMDTMVRAFKSAIEATEWPESS